MLRSSSDFFGVIGGGVIVVWWIKSSIIEKFAFMNHTVHAKGGRGAF